MSGSVQTGRISALFELPFHIEERPSSTEAIRQHAQRGAEEELARRFEGLLDGRGYLVKLETSRWWDEESYLPMARHGRYYRIDATVLLTDWREAHRGDRIALDAYSSGDAVRSGDGLVRAIDPSGHEALLSFEGTHWYCVNIMRFVRRPRIVFPVVSRADIVEAFFWSPRFPEGEKQAHIRLKHNMSQALVRALRDGRESKVRVESDWWVFGETLKARADQLAKEWADRSGERFLINNSYAVKAAYIIDCQSQIAP